MAADEEKVWKALADRTRRDILDLLRDEPRTTGQLCEPFALSRFGVMKHLRVLEGAGLVVVRPKGRERWHYLNPVPLRVIYERWVSKYQSIWAGALLSLKRQAEGERDKPSNASNKTEKETPGRANSTNARPRRQK